MIKRYLRRLGRLLALLCAATPLVHAGASDSAATLDDLFPKGVTEYLSTHFEDGESVTRGVTRFPPGIWERHGPASEWASYKACPNRPEAHAVKLETKNNSSVCRYTETIIYVFLNVRSFGPPQQAVAILERQHGVPLTVTAIEERRGSLFVSYEYTTPPKGQSAETRNTDDTPDSNGTGKASR